MDYICNCAPGNLSVNDFRQRQLFRSNCQYKPCRAAHKKIVAAVTTTDSGHSEINVSLPYESQKLQKFWQIAPNHYRYVVIANDGTLLTTR